MKDRFAERNSSYVRENASLNKDSLLMGRLSVYTQPAYLLTR